MQYIRFVTRSQYNFQFFCFEPWRFTVKENPPVGWEAQECSGRYIPSSRWLRYLIIRSPARRQWNVGITALILPLFWEEGGCPASGQVIWPDFQAITVHGQQEINLFITTMHTQNPTFLRVHYMLTVALSNCLISSCLVDSFISMR